MRQKILCQKQDSGVRLSGNYLKYSTGAEEVPVEALERAGGRTGCGHRYILATVLDRPARGVD